MREKNPTINPKGFAYGRSNKWLIGCKNQEWYRSREKGKYKLLLSHKLRMFYSYSRLKLHVCILNGYIASHFAKLVLQLDLIKK